MTNIKKVNIAIPEVYGDALSYYELLNTIYRDFTNEINQIIEKLDEHDKNFENVNAELEKLKKLIEQNSALIATNIENINTLKTKTDLIDSEITSINSEIANINIEIQNINSKIAVNTTNINNLIEKTNKHDNDISEIKTDISGINENITDLQNRMTTAEAEIEELKKSKGGTVVTFNYVSTAYSFGGTSSIKFEG